MSTSKEQTPNDLPTRKPYRGSCHCGLTQFQVYLTLPPSIIASHTPSPSPSTRLYKCNCTACTKMSLFHIRVPSSPDDFIILSPLNFATGGLKDYQCDKKRIHFYFCGECGVRCFAFWGKGEERDVEVDGVVVKGWSPKKEGWVEGTTGYLTVNAAALDQGGEGAGFDMREWHEKGWIKYVDRRSGVIQSRLGEPFEGGMY